jgi:purine-nucleoside phosphorylase
MSHSIAELSSSQYSNHLHAAADFIAKKLDKSSAAQLRIEAAIVLGSGLMEFTHNLKNSVNLPYSSIPYMPGTTVSGHTGELVIGSLDMRGGSQLVMCFAGRVHAYEGWPAYQVQFIVRLAAYCGSKLMVLTNSAGGAIANMVPGSVMIINDHIRFSAINPLNQTSDDARFGPRHIRSDNCYSRRLAAIARAAANKLHFNLYNGAYCWTSGPTYETPSEVQAGIVLGGGAFGMSTVPEVLAAHSIGLEVFGLSLATNMAAGLNAEEKLTHEDVKKVAAEAGPNFQKLLVDIFANLDLNTIPSNKITGTHLNNFTTSNTLLNQSTHLIANYHSLQPYLAWTPSLRQIEEAVEILLEANEQAEKPAVAIFLTGGTAAQAIPDLAHSHPIYSKLLNKRSIAANEFPAWRGNSCTASAKHVWLTLATTPANNQRVLLINGLKLESLNAAEASFLLQACTYLGISTVYHLLIAAKPAGLNLNATNNISLSTSKSSSYLIINDIVDRSMDVCPLPVSTTVSRSKLSVNSSSNGLAESVSEKLVSLGCVVSSGSYLAFAGPQLPSATEQNIANLIEVDSVGISNPAISTIAAVQLGLRVISLARLVNSLAEMESKHDSIYNDSTHNQMVLSLLEQPAVANKSIALTSAAVQTKVHTTPAFFSTPNKLISSPQSSLSPSRVAVNSPSNFPLSPNQSKSDVNNLYLDRGVAVIPAVFRQESYGQVLFAALFCQGKINQANHAFIQANNLDNNAISASTNLIPTNRIQPLAALFVDREFNSMLEELGFEKRLRLPCMEIPHWYSSALTLAQNVNELGLGTQFPLQPQLAARWVLYYGIIKASNLPLIVLIDESNETQAYELPALHGLNFAARMLKSMQIKQLITVSSITSTSNSTAPLQLNDVAVVRDHINLSGYNPLFGDNEAKYGTRFIDMGQAYSKSNLSYLANTMSSFKSALVAQLSHNNQLYYHAEGRFANLCGANSLTTGLIPINIIARHCEINVTAFTHVNRIINNNNATQTVKPNNRILSQLATAINQLINTFQTKPSSNTANTSILSNSINSANILFTPQKNVAVTSNGSNVSTH